MKTIDRDTCVVCDDPNIEVLGGWQNFPVYMGTTTDYDDVFVNQLWGICKKCGCVQLTKIIDPKVLYAMGHDHNPGTVGNTWNEHRTEFAKFILQNIDYTKNILEIGAGNVDLEGAIYYSMEAMDKVPGTYLIMDPYVDQSRSQRIEVIHKMWSHDIDQRMWANVDTIIHSHTMEHFSSAAKDIKAMADMLPENGMMCLSVTVNNKLLERGWTNSINFEHNYLTTYNNIVYMIHAAGFAVQDAKWFSDGNVFIAAKKVQTPPEAALVNEYEFNRELFLAYMNGLVTDAKIIGERLGEIPGPRFVFGAHIFTQSLVYSGLNAAKFLCVLDNDHEKQGKRLYGTSLMVESPEVIEGLDEPIVVVRAAQFQDEIVEQLKKINPSVIVI